MNRNLFFIALFAGVIVALAAFSRHRQPLPDLQTDLTRTNSPLGLSTNSRQDALEGHGEGPVRVTGQDKPGARTNNPSLPQ